MNPSSRPVLAAFLAAAVTPALHGQQARPLVERQKPIPVSTERHLFLDDGLVEARAKVVRVMHRPVKQADPVLVGRLEPHHGIDEQREERDERRVDDLGREPEAEPHDDERRQRHLGQRLEHHDIGVEGIVKTAQLKIEGMHCQACVRRVTSVGSAVKTGSTEIRSSSRSTSSASTPSALSRWRMSRKL